MERKSVKAINQSCSKFRILPCCKWEQNTTSQLLNSSKPDPESESELIQIAEYFHKAKYCFSSCTQQNFKLMIACFLAKLSLWAFLAFSLITLTFSSENQIFSNAVEFNAHPSHLTLYLYFTSYKYNSATDHKRFSHWFSLPINKFNWAHCALALPSLWMFALTLRYSLFQRVNRVCLQRREGVPESRLRPVAVLTTSNCASPSVQLTLTHEAFPGCWYSALLSPKGRTTEKDLRWV